jgi:O-antigen ligase
LTGLLILGAAGGVLLLFAGDRFWNEIDTSADYETGTGDQRLELWAMGVRMWEAHPVLGVGAGNFRWVSGDYQTKEQFEKLGHNVTGTLVAHSSHVEMLSELGTLGALAMILLTWSTWQGLGKIRPPGRRPGEPPLHPDLVELGHYADAVRCAILAILVNGTFLSLFYFSHLWVMIAVGTAMPYVHRRILQREAALAANAPSPVFVNNDTLAPHANQFGRRRGLSPRRKP